jgi:hypothetical protein
MRLDTVDELIAAIRELPAAQQHAARIRVEQALERPAREARVALGFLALDVVGQLADARSAQVIVLPEPSAVAATA